jgi:fructose-1,6-bisphosphatase/inositol monophosphatase family enzyme
MSTGFALPFGVTASIHTMTISRESSTADISSRANFLSPMSGIAREAGALLMGFFHRRVSIEYKGEADLVTEADRTSEALIRERIRKRWPEHDILGDPIVGRSRPLPMT